MHPRLWRAAHVQCRLDERQFQRQLHLERAPLRLRCLGEQLDGAYQGTGGDTPGLGLHTVLRLRRHIKQPATPILDQHQAAQVLQKLVDQLPRVYTRVHRLVNQAQPARRVAQHQVLRQHLDGRIGRRSQHRLHLGQGNVCPAEGDHLVQQGDGVAQPALGIAGDEFNGGRLGLETFGLADVRQVGDHVAQWNPLEREALAAREDGSRDFVRLGGRQEKEGVGGRLFERLEQCVEGRRGQHVDFVNDVDLVLRLARRELHLFDQVAHIVHAGMRRRVNLNQVQRPPLGQAAADGALAAGPLVRRGGAVDGARQDAGDGRLAGPARPGKQVGMRHAACRQGVTEGLENMGLADDVLERVRPPASIQGLRCHRVYLIATNTARCC